MDIGDKSCVIKYSEKKTLKNIFHPLTGYLLFNQNSTKRQALDMVFQKKSFKLSNFQYFYLICYQKDSIKNSQEIQISKTS